MKDLITILKICCRENFASQGISPRINEPSMAMTLEDQVKGFEVASSNIGPLAPVQCFAAMNATKAISSAKKILDLGCGTGHVVTKMAYINPDKQFIALDLSPGMLEEAKKLARKMGLTNIEFRLGDMTDLSQFKNQNIDAVTSSLALHHLRSVEDLTKTFCAVKDLLGDNGYFSFYDIGRLKSKESIEDLISLHNNHTPVYVEDTINSYQAAFVISDFEHALKISGLWSQAFLKTTLLTPTFIKANSKHSKMSDNQMNKLDELVSKMNFKNRSFFKILRFYFLE